MRSRQCFDSSFIIAHPVNFDIQRERLLKCDAKNSTHIYIKRFSVSVQPEITSHFSDFFFNGEKNSFSKVGRSVIGWWSGLIMLGFMDLRWLMVARHPNVSFVIHVFVVHYIIVYSLFELNQITCDKRSVLSSIGMKLNLHQASTQNWGDWLLQRDEYLLEQDCISRALWFQCNCINLGLDIQYNLGFCRFYPLRSILVHHFNVNIQHFDTSKLIVIAYDTSP